MDAGGFGFAWPLWIGSNSMSSWVTSMGTPRLSIWERRSIGLSLSNLFAVVEGMESRLIDSVNQTMKMDGADNLFCKKEHECN